VTIWSGLLNELTDLGRPHVGVHDFVFRLRTAARTQGAASRRQRPTGRHRFRDRCQEAGGHQRALLTADSSAQSITRPCVECIRLCLDCADVCGTAASVITRLKAFDSAAVRPLPDGCATICNIRGDECERHADLHEHCRLCAEACQRCEWACRELLVALTPS
jgi:Domain of Unknown Function (DUF326)